MRKLLLAGACALAASPALAHVHTSDCNHQWFEQQGSITAESLSFSVAPASSGGLTFVLNDLGGVGEGTLARAGFQAAAAMFSNLYTDNITIRLDVRFAALGPGILGSTGSTTNSIAYNALRGAMAADAKSTDDMAAVGTLPGAAPIGFVTNEPPLAGPIDARTRFFDNDNTFDNNNIQANTAQLKALGITPVYAANNPDGRDGSVSFSTAFNWDFDPTDGITPGSFDFVGVAAHEIGHALGFRSGVDLADINAAPGDTTPARGLGNIAWGTVHDLFRYGQFEGEFVRDWSIGGASCYSLDAATCLYLMSTGRLNGDGRQASHWKDNLPGVTPIGLMDPSVGQNLQLFFTEADIRAFDVMGYDRFVDMPVIPEPATWAMMILGFGVVGVAARRQRRDAATA